ncbi:hypothetical protein [Pseudobythopirellula maris]|nr:hypothetical protein [Pseudobythopirellula maris]
MNLKLAALAAALVATSVGCQSVGAPGPLAHMQGNRFAQGPPQAVSQASYQGQGMLGCMDQVGCGDNCGEGIGGGLFARGGGGCGSCDGCATGNGCINHMVGKVLDCGRCDSAYGFTPGPPSAQTAYPYYTVRGPRDFFMCNPPSIGPN